MLQANKNGNHPKIISCQSQNKLTNNINKNINNTLKPTVNGGTAVAVNGNSVYHVEQVKLKNEDTKLILKFKKPENNNNETDGGKTETVNDNNNNETQTEKTNSINNELGVKKRKKKDKLSLCCIKFKQS